MLLNIYDLSYSHPDRETLFSHIAFSLEQGDKASLIGNNGSGKSTLLKIIAGRLAPSSGSVAVGGELYYIPQHFGQYNDMTIAAALGIDRKIAALRAIVAGDAADDNYTVLGDDWDIEQRASAALADWGLEGYTPDRVMNTLSGGEKTKVFLAGIALAQPDIILLDEPTNHLDRAARERLYEFVGTTKSSVLVVSHDRTLLNLMDKTFELTRQGITLYGGNYEFYKEQKGIHMQALADSVDEKQKALRKAKAVEQAAMERKNRQDSRGRGKMKSEGVPRIMLKTITDRAQSTSKRLSEVHQQRIGSLSQELRELREKSLDAERIRIKFSSSGLHRGKTLVEAQGVNFRYGEHLLWTGPLEFRIESGDRLVIRGGNGSGKTTLIKLILGQIAPTEGTLKRADFDYLYIDQEYSYIDDRLTVLEQVNRHNPRNLPDSVLKTELHRFLFPADVWDKKCASLSGGEKMKLIFCCLLIANTAPDVFILDEPTNNLDIQSLEIVTEALRGYEGTLIVVSHDEYFLEEAGIEQEIVLSP